VQFESFSYKAEANVERLQFERSAVQGIGNELNNEMRVTAGDDDTAKLMDGRGGRDILVAAEGDDKLFGGEGNDILFGSGGNDSLDGGNGIDQLTGGDGADILIAGNGNDALNGNNGTDRLTAGNGNDFLNGGNDDDRLDGGDGNDRLFAQQGNDVVLGGAGDDLMDGREGRDTLSGGIGNDTIEGGEDGDLLSGGTGFDIFDYDGVDNVSTGSIAATRDTITDFTRGQDKIKLDVDANSVSSGDQDFTFIGTGAFTGPAQLRVAIVAEGTLVLGSTDFDAVAELAILLDDQLSLSAIDFLL
jgi:Ca2+-binding RTX toxin-like protein